MRLPHYTWSHSIYRRQINPFSALNASRLESPTNFSCRFLSPFSDMSAANDVAAGVTARIQSTVLTSSTHIRSSARSSSLQLRHVLWKKLASNLKGWISECSTPCFPSLTNHSIRVPSDKVCFFLTRWNPIRNYKGFYIFSSTHHTARSFTTLDRLTGRVFNVPQY